jgi:TM2 domain-containing membrane protein YozV
MSTVPEMGAPTSIESTMGGTHDHRGFPIPAGRMIATRFMELRKRRGLMIALILVDIGIPTIFLLIRLFAHAFAPRSYGPAGGYDIFALLVAGVISTFGFIVAATVGCTAGSADLTEGMFRHLVVTGRSRLALYLARIPAGLGVILPLVAIGYAIVCLVCVFSAPTSVNYQGVNVPHGLSSSSFESWAADHAKPVVCSFPYTGKQPANLPCGHNAPPPGASQPTPAALKSLAIRMARQNYPSYKTVFLYPSNSLMITSGLWIELEAAVGFVVGLGLASLLGQRTVPVLLIIVLDVILTPIFSTHHIAHLLNLQRSVVGLAMAHLEPQGLPLVLAGSGGGPEAGARALLPPESTTVAVIVILAWLVGWTILGAWRMATRDA